MGFTFQLFKIQKVSARQTEIHPDLFKHFDSPFWVRVADIITRLLKNKLLNFSNNYNVNMEVLLLHKYKKCGLKDSHGYYYRQSPLLYYEIYFKTCNMSNNNVT